MLVTPACILTQVQLIRLAGQSAEAGPWRGWLVISPGSLVGDALCPGSAPSLGAIRGALGTPLPAGQAGQGALQSACRHISRRGGCMPMAESPGSAVPKGGAASQDALLATKLHIPRERRGLVPRPRLVDRLTQALAGKLTVVCAPAGFGKTVVLADWARRGGRPVAWLSLDTGDNDPVRFWRHVGAAVDGVREGA